MKIYTKTGDEGETSLFGGRRVLKNDPRIEAYGTVDELNSLLGVARAFSENQEIGDILSDVQKQLFVLGADLATPSDVRSKAVTRIEKIDSEILESTIDRLDEQLMPLKSFILPGGSRTAAILHHARTVCRRAERLVIGLRKSDDVSNYTVIFLNRLSDLLFELARYANKTDRVAEILWAPRGGDETDR